VKNTVALAVNLFFYEFPQLPKMRCSVHEKASPEFFEKIFFILGKKKTLFLQQMQAQLPRAL
jgi:hypothetical protein